MTERLLKRVGLVLFAPVAVVLSIACGLFCGWETFVEMWRYPDDWTW